MKYNFVCLESHLIDHLAPIWNALPQENKTKFIVPKTLYNYANDKLISNLISIDNYESIPKLTKQDTNVVCSLHNYNQLKSTGKNVFYFEHGAGQIYNCDHASYASGGGRKNVKKYFATNQICHDAFIKNHNAESYIVGCAKLDQYSNRNWTKNNKICISFHWDCKVVPETQTSFFYYKDYLKKLQNSLKELGIELVGHGHPHSWDIFKYFYTSLEIPIMKNFDDIIEQCDMYIVDNSSTLFEFAATGKPVVVLNCPLYRKNIKHGMRFWEFADIGPQVDNANDLNKIVIDLYSNDTFKERRQEITNIIYPYMGESTNRIIKYLIIG